MNLDNTGQKAIEDLGAAINAAVEGSERVAKAISHLRRLGYELELTLRLEIGIRHSENSDENWIDNEGSEIENDSELSENAFQLTEEDLQILRRMKIGLGTDE